MTLAALVSILLVFFSFSINTTTQTQAHCLPDQRDALIQLKKGFNTTKLHSWNASTDCCIWDGIACDEQTGMVTAVNLAEKYISGKLHPALFNLSSLRYLNLADNNFNNSILPQTGFEQLGNLTYLDLSYSGFAGKVPMGFSALTNLIALNLSDAGYIELKPFYFHDKDLETLLSNLSNLQALRLDGVDISLNGSEWGKAVFQVRTTLQELSMPDCGLRGNLPDELFQLTNLIKLDLSQNPMLSGQLAPSITNLIKLKRLFLVSNRMTGTIPLSLFSHPSLLSLYLSHNQFSGYLPEFLNGSSILEHIVLDYNNLQGQVPISIFKSPQLELLSLVSNNFSGTLNIDVIKHNKNLETLDLSNNKLSITEGRNNESFYASFPQQMDVLMASCNLTKFPSFLTYLRNISYLDLSNNRLDGVIPDLLNSKESIMSLNLSHNFFTKIEGDTHFTSFSMLQELDIQNNRISGPVPLLPPYIAAVDFSSNYFHSLIPLSICNKSSLKFLDLSYNNFIGTMPSCLLENSKMEILILRSNKLTGPLSICKMSSLQFLDLSYNNFTGTIPSCHLENSEMEILNLRSNKLTGSLPRNISQGCKLRTIDLSGNRIMGSLPQSLMNCNDLEVLDLGNNQIVDKFPFWLGNLNKLRVLVLRSNQFYGTISTMEAKTKADNSFFPSLKVFDLSSNNFRGIIPKIIFENLKAMVTNLDSRTFRFRHYYDISIMVISKGQEMEIKSSLSIFSSLDLSQNGFSGEIPKEIGELKSLDVLNLSHNILTGPIPSEFSNLHQLQSLDLSFNQLSGNIPRELTLLTFLSVLNFSYNYLVGEIPQSHQFSTFQNDSYIGNPGLCGSPLSMQCATTPSNDGFNKDLPSKSSTDIIGLSISIGLGLGVGFASVIWALVSWENGREQFNFIVDGFYFRHIMWIVRHLCWAIGSE